MSLLNINQIKTIFEIDRTGELYIKLLSIFETDIPKLIVDLEMALKKDDLANAKKISHSIKSSSLNMGAAELAILAEEIERSDNTFDADRITEVQKCFQFSVTALKTCLDSNKH